MQFLGLKNNPLTRVVLFLSYLLRFAAFFFFAGFRFATFFFATFRFATFFAGFLLATFFFAFFFAGIVLFLFNAFSSVPKLKTFFKFLFFVKRPFTINYKSFWSIKQEFLNKLWINHENIKSLKHKNKKTCPQLSAGEPKFY